MNISDEVFYAGLEGKVDLKKQNPGLVRQHISFIPFEDEKKGDSSLGFSKDMGFMEAMRKVWNIQLNQEAPDEKLAVAEKVGNALGVSPQALVNDDELYKNCRLMYERQRNQAYLQNEKFSPQKVTELYPELSADDTVALTAATRDYVNVLKSRRLADTGTPIYQAEDSIVADFASVPGYLWNQTSSFAKTAYKAGEAQDNISEINYKNFIGELTDEEADKQIAKLAPAVEELHKQTGNSYISKIAGEGIVNGLTMIKTTWRGGEEVIKHLGPLAMELWKASENVIKPAATYAAAGGLAALGIAGAPAAAAVGVAAGAAGLVGLMGMSVYAGTYRVEAGSAYREYRMKKDAAGKPLYTQEECQNHAKRVGAVNAAIEAGAFQCTLFGVGKVFGKDAVMSIVKSESAREALIGAGRAAIAKKSLYQGGKQFVETAVPEILEEGAQSAVANLDENIFGKKTHTTSEVWNDAVNAMIEAVPGVIALSIGGAGARGIGSYHAMRSVSKMELQEHKEEFKRSAEADMSRGLFEVREESVYDKTAPGTFGKVVQNQMDKNGKGTMYIDAAELSETEQGREALRSFIQKGVAKETEVMASIQNNSPLEIQSGVYFQKANASTGDIVSYYTTFEKDGATMASIKRHKEALKEAARIQNETVKQREEEAAQRIISEDFADKTDIEKDAMRSVLAKGMEDVGKSWREAKEEAVQAWIDMLGNREHVETIQRKQKEGGSEVSVIDFVGEGGQYETKRVSGNEGWYRDAFKKEGKMPSQRSIMDYDHNETVREMEAGGATKEDIDALNRYKEKVEALEGLEDYVKTLDNKHLTAKILLNKDTFDKVYTPFVEELEKGNEQVKKAAKDSALILSKMAETLSRAYGVAVEDIAATLRVNDGEVNGYEQAMFDVRKAGINNLSDFYKRIKDRKEKGEAPNKIKYTDKNGVGYAEERITHIVNDHGFTERELLDLENSMDVIYEPSLSTWQNGTYEGQYHGKHVIGLIKGKLSNYYAVLAFSKNGDVWLDTAVKEKDAGVYKKEIGLEHAERLSHKGAASDSHATNPISISNIQKELGIVKKKEYNQPVNADVNPDEKVKIVDLTNTYKPGITKKELVQLLRNMAKEGTTFTSADEKAILSILPKNVRHVVYSSMKDVPYRVQKVRKQGIQSIKDLVNHSVLIESTPNTKRIQKPDVEMYHRFYVPVKVGGQVYAVRIVAEERNGKLNLVPKELTLYDVIIEKRPISAPGAGSPVNRTNGSFSTVTIKEMLQNVKDMENMPYYQQKDKYAGSYEAENNAIHIFSAGNESTAIHEGAHFFLSTLEKLSQDTTIPEEARGKIEEDLSVIRNWASYSPEVMKEYRGTALSKEFREYEKAIKENPDDESAKERFMQERFARGFERYLMTGKAPSKELQGAFRRFKSWLTNLYRSAMNLGKADAPEEMKQIFDKMVATEEEIEAWGEEVKARSLAEDINKLNKAVDTEKSEAGNIKEWLENIKETAKEKALSHFMKQYKGELLTQFDTAAEEKGGLRDQARERIRNEASDIYNIDIMRESGAIDKNILLSMIQSIGIETEEAFDKKIEELGGHLEERAEKEVQKERQKLIDEMLTEENIRSGAESLLLSPLGKSKLASIENKEITGLIKKYIRQYNAALLSLENKELTEAQIKEKVYEIKEKYGLLTEEEIADKTLKEEKRTDKEAIKDLKAEAETLKDRLKEMTAGLKEAADSFQTPMTALRKEAKAFLDEQTVSKATNSAWWERKAQTEEIKASQALFKRDFGAAGLHKKRQMEYEAIAYQAKRNEEAVYAAIHGNPKTTSSPVDKEGLEKRGILGVVNRIGRKENPVRLSEQSRYFVEHMAYQLGLTKKDGRLPTKDGESVLFSWEWLAREINPEKAQAFDENGVPYVGDDVIAPWAKALFEGNRGSYTRLPMQAFSEVMDAMKAVYRIGRREYTGNSFVDENGNAMSFDEAAEIIVKEVASDGLSPYERKVTATTADKIAGAIDKSVMELALPEVLIGRMGKKVYEIIYKPVDRAYKRKREMTEEALKTLKQIFGEGSFYTRKEWYSIRNEKKYIFGTTENGKAIQKTKENVLAMALNFGNQENRNRMCETYSCDESQIEQFLSENMEEKDWDFVEAVWQHIDSYWKERNAVQVRLYGVPLGKEKGITFTIKTKEGKTRKIEGMYYPICYDPEASSKTQERSIDEILRADMSGGGFAIGMGSTKARKKGSGGQKLREDLDVYVKHIEESINHITLREATVDVYKLLSRRDVADVIERKMGIAYCRELKQWAQDSWHNPIEKATSFDRFMNRMKRNYTQSVMMYRMSTALLNGANLTLYLQKMGAARTISSISRYWLTTPGKRKEIRAFILKNSSMMRNRETNLDADLARGINVPSAKGRTKGADQVARAAEPINRRGYQFIAYTDSILSCPMWYETYWGEMLKQEASGVNPELRHENAVLAADKMVRETFGSGEEKDKPGIMRRGNIKNFIPFYTYTNLVMNQFIRGGYKIFDGDIKGGVKDLVGTTLYWWILQAVMEASIRHALAAASDGEDKYNWWQRFGYAMISGGPIGGIPFLRDAVPAAYAHLSGMYSDDGVPRASGLEIVAETGKLLQAMTSDNKDWTDVGRAAGRVTNRAFGFSDTVSDGFWTMVRVSTSDTESTAREMIASVLLDKNLKKKKKETKKGQVKDAQTRYLEMKEKERKRKEKKNKEQK